MFVHQSAGNQSPDPLIDFLNVIQGGQASWESVTRPLDRLRPNRSEEALKLGISHQTP